MRTALRYSFAVLTVAIALVPTTLLAELLAPMRLFFLWFAVLVSALAAGTGAALLATGLALAGAYLVAFPGELTGQDVIRLALFGLFAGGISVAVGRTKTLARRLRENELRYRTLVEATPVAQAVWTAAPDGTMKSAPQWLDSMHPEDAARMRERWAEAVARGTLYEDEVRIALPDGRQRWFAIKATPVRAGGGRITEWVALIVDIHERKRQEHDAEFLNRASELLSATLAPEETLRNLARLCVPALGDWCAIDLAEASGYRRVVVERAGTADTQLAPDLQPDPIVAPMVARGRTLGALTVACEGQSGRCHSQEDVPLIEDLARRAAVALDNARLYEAADAANRAKDDFLATLSHELRTPLTAVSGWAHMLSTGIEDPETLKLAVDTIVRSAKAQEELIDDLLDLSRVVAGTLRLELSPVDLAVIVHEVLVAARPAAEAKDVTLELTSASAPVIVHGDERRLRQVIWNLVTNAVKFTGRGGSARVSVGASGAMAVVEVSDTGRGIDASFLPHVWERFRQADGSTSREYGGLGLGLAVVRHLVEMHGGTVHAESEGRDRGSLFRVELPLDVHAVRDDTGHAFRYLPERRHVEKKDR